MAEKRNTKDSQVTLPFGHGPGHMHHAPVQRAGNTWGVARRLWGCLKAYRRGLLAAVGLVTVTALLALAGPYLTGRAIDDFIVPGDMAGLARIAGLMVLVYVLTSLGTWAQSVMMIRVAEGSVRDIRKQLLDKLQTLSVRFFDQNPRGELMSRLTNDTAMLSQTLAQSITQFIASTLSIVGAGTAMIILNWRLAIASVVTLPLLVLLTRWLAARSREGFRRRQQALGALNGIIEETVAGQRVITICGHKAAPIGDFSTANRDLRKQETRAQILVGLMGPLMGMLRNLGFAIIAGFGGWLILKDLATVGTVAAFMSYSQQFSRPLHQLAGLYGSIQSAFAGAERVFDIMDEKPEITDADDTVTLDHVKGDVAFENVSFGYVDRIAVLDEVTFHAEPGQTIALVGPTGAGKTTIINLLTRFYDVENGCIRVDGHDIREVRKDDLRRALGIVLQDTFLFAAAVRDNIAYGRPDASDDEIRAAARLANADGFIRHLPHGYDTKLSEVGGSISQGQRQLLAIARAVLADPAILVLDEATSSVDTHTEVEIQQAMHRLMAGRTSFVIAHRLSTIRTADRILVIKAGRIVEHGTHEELLAASGVYQKMYTMSQQATLSPPPRPK